MRVSTGHNEELESRTNVGRSNLTFFSMSLNNEKGSTAPEAFPTETIVPLRLIILKLLSNLFVETSMNYKNQTRPETDLPRALTSFFQPHRRWHRRPRHSLILGLAVQYPPSCR